ncbi:hypothetical protein N869_09585 [Cellulomonas bogoriensis 69B4 = DSM 16987]|uniref:Uncharacterized protein n=1 Tax=Cellulomonas bogoriensis 69B4 = DSM 16987 TaxID=1386082 RepID=A0A0A0C0W4_9CELL|nr:hypothetical protein N869_09585 [Cellulomonas bogoriensis 69B4 = DSM 16987]
MYVLSDTYVALVSFIAGFDAATEGELLDGFDAWVATASPAAGASSFAWPVVVASRTWEAILDGRNTIDAMPRTLQQEAKADLMRLLDEFLADRATNAAG